MVLHMFTLDWRYSFFTDDDDDGYDGYDDDGYDDGYDGDDDDDIQGAVLQLSQCACKLYRAHSHTSPLPQVSPSPSLSSLS